MNEIAYKNFNIELIHKASLKNTYLSVGIDKKILVKTSSKSNKFIIGLLKERESWILKQIQNIEKFKTFDVNMEDEVLLFGDVCSIDNEEVAHLRNAIHKLKISTPQKIERCYNDFYKQVSQTYLKARVEYFASIMNLDYEALKYRKMKSRWGSCSSKKVITLNSELMKIGQHLIDYVIVHELAHLVHMNHSLAFHTLVNNYLPDSKALIKELKKIRLLP